MVGEGGQKREVDFYLIHLLLIFALKCIFEVFFFVRVQALAHNCCLREKKT